jgi:hypothetical protein
MVEALCYGRSQVQVRMRSLNFFNLSNPSSRTMAPGVYSACNGNEYQEKKKKKKKNLVCSVWPVCRVDNLSSICEPIG